LDLHFLYPGFTAARGRSSDLNVLAPPKVLFLIQKSGVPVAKREGNWIRNWKRKLEKRAQWGFALSGFHRQR
jgi:hypothetical protein